MRGRAILVVEDDGRLREILVQALRSAGFAVSAAETGRRALTLAAAERHDVMLTDYQLPDMSGLELHRSLVRLDPRLARRTFFMSGADLGDAARHYVRSCGRGFFAKPFDLREALAAIRAAARGTARHRPAFPEAASRPRLLE
jgi:DNA-binding response OmpR family regulator